MPVALKLSEEFYERLGHKVVNEFVDALNVIDTSYRQEFRELFEAHFGRLEARFDAFESRLSAVESRLEHVVDREALESRLTGFESRFEARMDARLAELKSELLRWMFLFWVGTMGTVLAILKL